MIGLAQEFGVMVTFAKMLQTATRKIPKINEIAGKIKYKAITDFLYRENKEILDRYNQETHRNEGKIGEGNVWVLWWQGMENAPEIVKLCVESIKKNIGSRKLIVIDANNYREYTELDSYYIELMESNRISKTQFSDLLRLNLLYGRGGVWLDATYLLTGALPEYIRDFRFFTIRHGMEREYPMSKGLWSTSALGSTAHTDELKLFQIVYRNYYKNHSELVDYLLTDYIFAVCCDHCKNVQEMFEDVPPNNQNVNELLKVMNKPYSAELIAGVTDGTVMNKLNRRYPFQARTFAGETVYGHYRDLYL